MKTLIPVLMCVLIGCGGGVIASKENPKEPKANPLKPKPTQDIAEHKGENEVVIPDVEITNPITGALEAYEPMKQQIAQLGIEHAVNLFHALEGRYPKDHAEFMQRVIKENNIKLPTLGIGFKYEYDVANHELLIVKDGGGK